MSFSGNTELISEPMMNQPADRLFLISDACLPECTIRLLQAESDSPLQVIFIIPGQVNHICNEKIYARAQTHINFTLIVNTQETIFLTFSVENPAYQ